MYTCWGLSVLAKDHHCAGSHFWVSHWHISEVCRTKVLLCVSTADVHSEGTGEKEPICTFRVLWPSFVNWMDWKGMLDWMGLLLLGTWFDICWRFPVWGKAVATWEFPRRFYSWEAQELPSWVFQGERAWRAKIKTHLMVAGRDRLMVAITIRWRLLLGVAFGWNSAWWNWALAVNKSRSNCIESISLWRRISSTSWGALGAYSLLLGHKLKLWQVKGFRALVLPEPMDRSLQ